MAQVATIKGTQLQIKIDNGLTGTNQAYVHPCLINSTRGITWSTTGTDDEIPDCANPDALAFTAHTKTGISGSVSGAGKLNYTDVASMWAWLNSDTAKTCQIDVYGTAGGTWSGGWKLTDFAITGDRGKVAECTLTIKSDGVQTYLTT